MVVNSRSSNWTKILGSCNSYYQEGKGHEEMFEFPRGTWARVYGFYAFTKVEDGFMIWVHSTEQVVKPSFICHNFKWYRLTEMGKESVQLTDCPKGRLLKPEKLAMKVQLIEISEEVLLEKIGMTKEELLQLPSPNGMATIRL